MCVIGMGWCQREILQISDLTSRGIIIVISVSFFTVLNSPELICKVIFPIEDTTCILYTGDSLLMDTSGHVHLCKMDSYSRYLSIFTPFIRLSSRSGAPNEDMVQNHLT